MLSPEKTLWHSEQFFGACPDDPIISEATLNMLNSDRQVFGNPGNCKELVQSNKSRVTFVPSEFWDPTGETSYGAKNWEITTQNEVRVNQFLKNTQCALIKIYNSTTSRTEIANLSVADFLNSDTLMANLFLKIEPDRNYWIERTERISSELSPS